MFIPYFNTPDNYHKYNHDLKVANGYCLNCNKPLKWKHIYCENCGSRKMFSDGLEGSRVTLGLVGHNVINYQQYLHRSIFDCNALDKYRGVKEDRIKAKVSKKAMNTATIRLRRALSCSKFVYLGKTHYNNKHNVKIYNQVKDVRNIDKRLVYNIAMYYISYHIENNPQFKTFIHFQTSMLNNLLINVENTHLRVNKPTDLLYSYSYRKNNIAKYWYWLFTEVDSIMQPVMNDIIDSIN